MIKVVHFQLICLHNFRYNSVVSYTTTEIPIFSQDTISNAAKINVYDSLDADVVQSYLEYNLASLIYYAMKVIYRGLISLVLKRTILLLFFVLRKFFVVKFIYRESTRDMKWNI